MKTQRKFTVLRGSLDGRGVSRRMDTCTCMAELLCCLPEIITTLLFGYVLSSSAVSKSVTPWTVACLAPLSMVILQASILERMAMPSSRVSSQPRDQTQVTHIAGRFFNVWATRETQEYWNGLLCPLPGDLPNPGIEPTMSAMSTWIGRWVLYHSHHLGSP